MGKDQGIKKNNNSVTAAWLVRNKLISNFGIWSNAPFS